MAFASVFGASMAGLPTDAVARAHSQRRSVLDFVIKDLNRLRPQVPAAQSAKLDQHLTAIRELETKLSDSARVDGADRPDLGLRPARLRRRAVEHGPDV